MKKIIQYFINYPMFAYLLIPVLIIGGMSSFVSMKRSFFPEIETRNITVSVFYPGASPKEMEEGITTRIEHAVRGIVGLKEINSTSAENFSSVVITTTGEYDIDETLMEVKNAVDGISAFPVGAERPIVFKQRSRSLATFLAIYGDIDLIDIKKYAYKVEDDFLASGIISQIILTGFPSEEISVEVNEETLLRYGITFDEISTAIAMNNTDMAAGQIKSSEEEILIRSRYRTVNPNKIGEIIVRAFPDGKLLRIRDLGEVKIKFADEVQGFTQNGKTGISLQIYKLPEEDLVKISDFIAAYVDEFNRKHPEVTLEVSFDFLEMLKDRLELLQNNGIFGLLLVIISLAIFLNLYLSFWVAWGIPASFLALFIIGNYFGLTINMISLFGMILVIGILVDDGIVIGENIFTHFERGKSPKRAALDGTMEVMPAVLTSVTTTIVAFVPVLLVTQGGMEFMHDMAFVVIISLAFSLIEAFFVLPSHLSHKKMMKKESHKTRLRKNIENIIFIVREKIYGRILKVIIRWKWIAIFVPVFLIFLTIGLFGGGFIKYTFFPNITFDTFSVNFAFTPGTGEKKTIEYLKRFEKIIWEVNDELIKKTGDTLPYIDATIAIKGMAFEGGEMGAHAGRIESYFKDLEGRKYSANEVAEMVREKIGPVPEAEKFSVFSGFDRWGKPISISLQGDNLDVLTEAKKFLKEKMASIQTIKNITDNNPLGKQEVDLKLKPEAYILGINQAMLTNQVRQGFFGGQAQRLQNGKDELRVWVRYPKSDRRAIGQLEDMKIKTLSGEYPLSQIADYTIERSPVSIKRYNVNKEIRIEADLVNPMDPVPPILDRIKSEIITELQDKFKGVKVEYMGQAKSSDESTKEMGTYFMIALLVILLIITIHFKSVSQMTIILMMIPLGWLGAIWGHGLRGLPVSMLSAWGMVALTGVIINDAVVFMSKFNSLLKEGMKIGPAIYLTGIARFRAIMLTTITTVLGLFPLILETSFQAQFLIPMAVSLAFGVLFGTAFILLFLPAILLVFNDIRCLAFRFRHWLWQGGSVLCIPEEREPAIINAKKSEDF